MATLEEVIRQRLAEATKQVDEAKVVIDLKKPEPEEVGGTDVIDTKPKVKKELTKESLDDLEVLSESASQPDKPKDVGKLAYAMGYHGVEDDKMTKNQKAAKAMLSPQYIASWDDDKKAGAADRPKVKLKEDTVSSQVASLLEAEGLSEEFKTQAVTIFEAAVTDRVLQIEEGLKTEFDKQLVEAKAELDNDIDGFLSEAIQQWKQDNEVAIKANFKSQLAESFMDGMKALIKEHNIEVPEDKEDALEVALGEVDKLNESIVAKEAEMLMLQEQVNEMKSEKILESFKEKMTQTEFDRFVQLTESVKFKDETQYEKQLNIVLENFGSTKVKPEVVVPVVEAVTEAVNKIVTESNSDMAVYTQYLNKKR
jgi:hypothetical protein